MGDAVPLDSCSFSIACHMPHYLFPDQLSFFHAPLLVSRLIRLVSCPIVSFPTYYACFTPRCLFPYLLCLFRATLHISRFIKFTLCPIASFLTPFATFRPNPMPSKNLPVSFFLSSTPLFLLPRPNLQPLRQRKLAFPAPGEDNALKQDK